MDARSVSIASKFKFCVVNLKVSRLLSYRPARLVPMLSTYTYPIKTFQLKIALSSVS